jgi:hypothetical protein
VQADGRFSTALVEWMSDIESDWSDWREILKSDTCASSDVRELEVLVPQKDIPGV